MELIVVLFAFLVPVGMHWLSNSKTEHSEDWHVVVVFGYMAAVIALFLAASLAGVGLTVLFVWLVATLGVVAWSKLTREDRDDQ